MTTGAETSRRAQRLAAAREHIRLENAGDVDAIVATFGNSARYIDEPWGISQEGAEEVRAHYERLAKALPDLRIDIEREHAGADAVVLELRVSGTHLGPWRGVPATGRRVNFSACVVFSFDDEGKIADERAYYDRASVLRQIGLFHDPDTLLGRVTTTVAHPVTTALAATRAIRRRRPKA